MKMENGNMGSESSKKLKCGEIPIKFYQNLSKNQWKEFKNNEFVQIFAKFFIFELFSVIFAQILMKFSLNFAEK